MGNAQNNPVLLQDDPDPITRQAKLIIEQSKYQLQQKTFGLTEEEQAIVGINDIPPMVSVKT